MAAEECDNEARNEVEGVIVLAQDHVDGCLFVRNVQAFSDRTTSR